MIRLQKYLASLGFGSRRQIEQIISQKRISVDGNLVTTQGVKINPQTAVITLDGQLVKVSPSLVYYWLNKPPGVVSSAKSQSDEQIITRLVPSFPKVFPVGRLDKDSQGLILLTNDGELTHRLTHPKFHLTKTYKVQVSGSITFAKVKKLSEGIEFPQGMTLPAIVDIESKTAKGGWLIFTLTEGKFRQIRRMCVLVDLHVLTLIRVSFGPIALGKLGLGEYRPATLAEIKTLYDAVGLEKSHEKRVK